MCSKFAPVQPGLLRMSVLCRDAGHSEGHDPSWVEMNPEGTLPRGITDLNFQAMWLTLSLYDLWSVSGVATQMHA